MTKTALIVGAGSGISAAFARALHVDGYKIALAARDTGKLAALAKDTGANVLAVDAASPDSVAALFAEADRALGQLGLVLYNASYRTRGPFLDLDPGEVAKSLAVTAYGGFLVGQQAASLGFIFENPDTTSISCPRAGNTRMSLSLGTAFSCSTAASDRGNMWARLFFVRSPGISHCRLSSSSSLHRMPATSPRRCAVRINSCTSVPNG